MCRSAICTLSISAVLSAIALAQAMPGPGAACAGLPSFGPEDSLNTADFRLEKKDLRVRVNAKGPPLHLRLEPDAAWKPAADAVQRVGWIRVFSCETGALIQSLEVEIWSGPEPLGGPERFLRFFEARDVNFDGYLDIAVLREFGAKWGRQTWWVYSPVSGKFVSDEFTKALGQVSANGLVLNPAQQNIIAGHLTTLTGCGDTKDIYQVEQHQRLVLMHEEEIITGPEGCTLTVRDRVDGQMKVTKAQHFSPYRELRTHP